MSGIARIGMIGIAMAGLCAAQQFEVVSVKPSGTPPHLAYTIDDSRVELGGFSLRSLIQMAYRLDSYQVDAPTWMGSTLLDVQAKLPAGATKEQVPEMIRAMLADRFKLVAHHENREQEIYALLPGKNGLKLEKGDADNSDRSFLNGRRILNQMTTSEGDGIWTISSRDQQNVFNAPRISLREFAETLLRYVDEPVVDMTRIAGFWKIRMDVPRGNPRIRAAVVAQTGITPPSDPDGDVSIFASVQKLGLVLEKRKAPVDHLIIDSVEKAPTEN